MSADSGAGPRQGSRLEPAAIGGGAPKGEDQARTGGRGFLLITGAKLWFMVMGAVVTIGLPLFMSQQDFGIYNIVINAGGLLNMVVITGSLQAVSKLVSEQPERSTQVLKRALAVQCLIGVPLALVYILGAGVIAGWFSDPSLAPLLRISGGVTLAYAFYAIFVGYLNGHKAFGRQAMLDVIFSTLKSALIIGLVLGGFGVVGALWGFVGASVLVLLVSMAVAWRFHARGEGGAARVSAEEEDGAGRQLVRYILWVMLYTFCIFGVLRTDLFLLKAMIGAQESGAQLANQVAGVYGAVQYVSRLPFQAVIAVTFVVFPMLSRATFSQDHEATRLYIGTTLRYSLILVSLLSAIIAGNARDIVLALYGEGYQDGVLALMVLGVATVGYALFYIATTMITGSGKPEVSAGVAAATLLATVGLNAALIHGQVGQGLSQGSLCLAASAATAVAMVLGFGMALLYLRARYQARLGWLTVGRVSLACLAVVGFLTLAQAPQEMGRMLRLGVVVGKSALAGALFLLVLWVTREFGAQDKDRLLRVFRRRKAGGGA